MVTEEEFLNQVRDLDRFQRGRTISNVGRFVGTAMGGTPQPRVQPAKIDPIKRAEAIEKLAGRLAGMEKDRSGNRLAAAGMLMDRLKLVFDTTRGMMGADASAAAQVTALQNKIMAETEQAWGMKSMAAYDQWLTDPKARDTSKAIVLAGAKIAGGAQGGGEGGASVGEGLSGSALIDDTQFLDYVASNIGMNDNNPAIAGATVARIAGQVPGGMSLGEFGDRIARNTMLDANTKNVLLGAVSIAEQDHALQEKAREGYAQLSEDTAARTVDLIQQHMKGGGLNTGKMAGVMDFLTQAAGAVFDPETLATTVEALAGENPDKAPPGKEQVLQALDALLEPGDNPPATIQAARQELFDSEGFKEFANRHGLDLRDSVGVLRAARAKLHEGISEAKRHNAQARLGLAEGAEPVTGMSENSADTNVGLDEETGKYETVTNYGTQQELDTASAKKMNDALGEMDPDARSQKEQEMAQASKSSRTQGRVNDIFKSMITERARQPASATPMFGSNDPNDNAPVGDPGDDQQAAAQAGASPAQTAVRRRRLEALRSQRSALRSQLK